jgi:hypothetical protein
MAEGNAEANQAATELARTLRELQQELANNGRMSTYAQEKSTDAAMKAKYGVDQFSRASASAAGGLMAMGDAGFAAGKAMLEGKKGAAAFNGALDSMTTSVQMAGAALALLVPGGILIKGLIAGITMAATAFIKYTQTANEMADKLYTGYRGLAEVGAAAADGMTGVMDGALKLGMSMDELGDYVKIVSENSRELAQFGGSVATGRRALENIGKAMEPARESMLKMGLMPKDVAEGSAAFLRMQTRVGMAQGKTVDQLAEGARKYLVEQDALTKITGTSRKEAEKREETARAEEQYAGMLMKLRAKGDEAEIKRLTSMSQMMGSLDQDVAKAVRSLMTGYITPEGEKLLMNAPDALKEIQAFKDKKITQEQLADRIFKGMADTGARVSAEYATMGAGADTFMSAATQLNAMNISAQGVEKSLKEAKIQQDAQGATGKQAHDKMLQNQVELINIQVRANKEFTLFIEQGIIPAQNHMKTMAGAALDAAIKLRELAGMAKDGKMSGTVKETASVVGGAGMGAGAGAIVGGLIGLLAGPGGALIGAKLGAVIGTGIGGYLLKNTAGELIDKAQGSGPPGRAVGGPVDAGKLYKVGERGEEYFRPGVAGEIVPNDKISGIAGAANNRIDIIQRAAKEIADDTATLAKLTDVDLKKTQDASRVQDRLRKLKTELAIDEVELLEEQKEELTKMLDDMEKSMGKGSADAMRKSIAMQRAMGGGMGSGRGLQMPSAPGLPSMGGGQGLQVMNQDDLKKLGLNIKAGDVQASNAKISPKLIELAKAIQGGVPGFGYFSSFNDKFHNENAPSSMHTQGLAVDFTTAQPPSIEDGKAITAWLKSMGASVAIDEYNSPTAKSTGGHFHAQLPAFEDGGTLGAGKLGIAGEAGKPELITGPAEITPINELMKAFGSLAGMMSQSVDKLDELVRAQKTNNDISNKILRTQA